MVLTMAAVADNKQIKTENIAVHIGHTVSEGKPWITAFRIRVDLGNHLTQREQKILFNSARHCEVHKMLFGEFTFDFEKI